MCDVISFKKSRFKRVKQPAKNFNKPDFLSFACGQPCCTFVLSIRTNGGDTERSGNLLTTDSETFHEIIYGKSERGANERRVFFVPTRMALLRSFVVFSLVLPKYRRNVTGNTQKLAA